MVDLTGRPIAISGASSGIGEATALACASAGMPVALMARRADRLESVAERIRSFGGKAVAVPGSVESDADAARLTTETLRAFGDLYAVFANAGYGSEGLSHALPDSEIRAMFEVNFYGSLNVIRPALDHMLGHGRGHVLLCSSCLSKIGIPYYATYCATKAAQDYFGRAMRHELRPQGIHVSTVHPIGTKTEFFDTSIERSGSQRVGIVDAGPRMFMQPPERVANAVVRCLRRPRGEVWTSRSMRTLLALGVAMPRFTDLVLGRALRRRLSSADQTE